MHQIRPLLRDLKIEIFEMSGNFHLNSENFRIILANLVPLMDSIYSLYCEYNALPTMWQCFGQKLAKAEVLRLQNGPDINFYRIMQSIQFVHISSWIWDFEVKFESNVI